MNRCCRSLVLRICVISHVGIIPHGREGKQTPTFGYTATPTYQNNFSGLNTQNVVWQPIGNMPTTGLITNSHIYMGGNGGTVDIFLYFASWNGTNNIIQWQSASTTVGNGLVWTAKSVPNFLVTSGTNINVGFYANPSQARQWESNNVGGVSWYWETQTGSFVNPGAGTQVSSRQMGAYLDYTPVSLYGYDSAAWQASVLDGFDGGAQQQAQLLAFDGSVWQVVGCNRHARPVPRGWRPPRALARLAAQDGWEDVAA